MVPLLGALWASPIAVVAVVTALRLLLPRTGRHHVARLVRRPWRRSARYWLWEWPLRCYTGRRLSSAERIGRLELDLGFTISVTELGERLRAEPEPAPAPCGRTRSCGSRWCAQRCGLETAQRKYRERRRAGELGAFGTLFTLRGERRRGEAMLKFHAEQRELAERAKRQLTEQEQARMTRSSKGRCGYCRTKRCMQCGRCPNIDCESSVSCEHPESSTGLAVLNVAPPVPSQPPADGQPRDDYDG